MDLSDPHDALLDKDADGRNNLEEYLTGRDPLTPYEYEVHHQDDAPATDAASLPDVGLPESVLLYDVDFGTPPHTVGEPVVIDPGPVPRTCPSGRRFIPAIVVEQLGLLYDQPASLRASQLIFHAEPSYEYPGISPSYPRYIVSMDLLIEQPGAGPMDYLKVFLDSPRIRTVRFSMDGAISKSQPAGSSAFLGRWEPGIPVRLRIDADLRAQRWNIYLDGTHVNSSDYDATRLRSVRVSMHEMYAVDTVCAVDNIRIWGVTGPGPVDLDYDGVLDDLDLCHETELGLPVDPYGCSVPQHCPCVGPEPGVRWKNFGSYVGCVKGTAHWFADEGWISRNEAGKYVRDAARAGCGHAMPRAP